MKPSILFILLALFPMSLLGQHVPPCGGNKHSDHAICYAYAQGRAFGAQWSQGDCQLSTLWFNYIDDRFFQKVALSMPDDIKNIQANELLDFGGSHYAFVTSIGLQTASTIRLAQVDHDGGNEQPDLALATVRDGDVPNGVTARGWPTARWFLKAVFKITASNDFGAGNVNVGGYTHSSPDTVTGLLWKEQRSLAAVASQSEYGGYIRQFSQWNKNGASFSTDSSTSGYPDGYDPGTPTAYTATFTKKLAVTFQNNLPGTSGGNIIVSGLTRASAYSTQVPDANRNIEAKAVDTTILSVDFRFAYWTNDQNNDTVRTQDYTFTVPANHTTYTARFTAKPFAPTNVQAGAPVDQYVVVSWTDNPNSNVTQYPIWRKTKYGSSTQVATVNSGVRSWTDPVFKVTGTGSDSMLTYTVYAYYSPSGTLSDGASQNTWATYYPYKVREIGPPAFEEEAIPTTFGVGSYPNPFNPSTTIAYQVAKDASVKLEIYDVMGRKVRTLADQTKSAGYYTVTWNGRDEMGMDVASGVYLYRFVASPTNGEKPFTQSGKLVLTR